MKHSVRLLARIVLLASGVGFASAAYAQTDAMNAVLQRLMAGIKKLENSCGADIKKHCSDVTPGDGRIMHCLQAYEDKLSPECEYDLDEAELQLQTTLDHLREAVNACRSDIDKLCAKTTPGQGRIAACLAANRTSVSQTCVEAVQRLQDR